jgi:glycosyltransferase involved in cell wall biosynthesis
MSRVQATMPEAELVVIGDGPLRPALERLAGETLCRYRFLGTQPQESVRAWLNRARVFSLPSVTAESGDSEGLPTTVIEAQASGLPVVSTIHAGIPEAVAHGETGFLVPERDWEGLASSILLLLRKDALCHRFAVAGKGRVRALFDLQKQTALLEEIYEDVLSEKGGP